MLKTRLALAALLAAAAALIVLLAASSAAPAQDLESKLEAKEAKLSKVRERTGVLTTTISHPARSATSHALLPNMTATVARGTDNSRSPMTA